MAHILAVPLLALFLFVCAFAGDSSMVPRPTGEDKSEGSKFQSAREEDSTSLLQAGFTPEGEFQCTPERGFLRDGGTFNDPDSTITESPLHCCRLCFDDSRCQTWSRERSTGTCALMDVVAPLVENAEFDSGVLDAADAQETVTAADCDVVRGVSYPDGMELEQRTAANARRCCERCRDNGECFSWHYHGPSERCVLNADVPSEVSDNEYSGNAFS